MYHMIFIIRGKNTQHQNEKLTNLKVMSHQHKLNTSIGNKQAKKTIKNHCPTHPKHRLLKQKESTKQRTAMQVQPMPAQPMPVPNPNETIMSKDM